ncbi:MAG: hypothetical protein H6Q89_2437, partial [Myxococcaceae bacterium]|nr:hypothetical protein [Myxococcaceae bacterium]
MRLRSLVCLVLLASPTPALADEGMWTFNHFPAEKVKSKYGWSPTQEWLDHVRLASVKIAAGCSASVVSPEGLVLTNQHCARSCLAQLSTPKQDLVKAGFYAKTLKDEVKCPEVEMNQLLEITDVTRAVQDATRGVEESKFNAVQRSKIAEIEKACATSDEVRCDVVSLYRGGNFDLYKYRRFQDVRLVFAPEFEAAFFGGDPDNFTFPRYAFDMSFLRIYGADGKPAKAEHYLQWSKENAKEGDLTFVPGNPGGTSRLLTIAQLEAIRDVTLPITMIRLGELRGLLTEYGNRGVEQRRHSLALLFSVENSLKAYRGRHGALADRKFFGSKVAAEAAFKAKIAADPNLKKTYSGVWDAEDLGADHPAVKQVFGKRSPEEIAREVVKNTRLKDVKLRTELFADGKGKEKVDASKDPLILLAKAIDPAARAERKKWEDEIEGPQKKQGEQLAKAYFAVYGTSTYPDATSTL